MFIVRQPRSRFSLAQMGKLNLSIASVIGALLLAGAPASAQMVQGAGNVSAARAADALSLHLRTLMERPQDVPALLGAGEAALALDDPAAAIGFLARAEKVAPRNGQVKAGLGRALLMLERPRDALKLFDDATDLGVPDATIAGDRGLAHDLRGDYRRAQRDYQLALSRGADDEITRRYALSLGISGDRDKALALLNPLLYKRDQAAWRSRAFVLALTGDKAGANGIVRSVMPARQAAIMEAFMDKLPSLKTGEKAMAVHLGHFPSQGQRYAAVEQGGEMRRADPTLLARAETPRAVAAQPVSRAPRRRPGSAEQKPRVEPDATRLASVMTSVREQAAVGGEAVSTAEVETLVQNFARPEPRKPAAKSKKAEPKAPARHWVQVAGGANERALPREWKRVTAKAPDQFKGRTPYTVAANATNRLLAGPFETAAEARRFVNALAKAGVDAFAWTSAAGQEIAKLSLK